MSGSDSPVPKKENLRRAVRWLSEQGRHDRAAIEEASRRFDLSPLDEDFLLRHFGERGGQSESRS